MKTGVEQVLQYISGLSFSQAQPQLIIHPNTHPSFPFRVLGRLLIRGAAVVASLGVNAGVDGMNRLAERCSCRTSAIVSGCICMAHGFFLYAQVSGLSMECGMEHYPQCARDIKTPGGLFEALVSAHVSFDASGALETGLEALTTSMCYDAGHYVDCKAGRYTPLPAHGTSVDALCTALECGGLDFNSTLLHLSYLYSIEHLWSQPGWRPGEKPNGQYPGRPASGMLFTWSFVWPHVKLGLMHAYFYLRMRPGVRRNGIWWFDFFGKWSLSDVLVLAAVLALFNLEVKESFIDLWTNLRPHFIPLCDAFCLTHFGKNLSIVYPGFANSSAPIPPSNCSTACHAIDVAVSTTLIPENLPQSELYFQLRIEGCAAMYTFCIAVLLSLFTGMWVEHKDEELRDETHTRKLSIDFGQQLAISGNTLESMHLDSERHATGSHLGRRCMAGVEIDASPQAITHISHSEQLRSSTLAAGLLANSTVHDPTNEHVVMASSSTQMVRRRRVADCLLLGMHVSLVLLQLVAVIGSFTLPAFERVVSGAMSDLLLEAGIDFTAHISLWSLPYMTARGGGLDYFIAATFTLFIIVMPLVRSLSLLALLLVPMRVETARWLHVNSRRVVGMTALDVMLIATPLIGIAFGPMSEVLLNDQSVHFCKLIEDIYSTGHRCLRIDVIPEVGYWFNVAAVALYLLSGFDGSPTSKFIHRRLYPHDQHPPPSLQECRE